MTHSRLQDELDIRSVVDSIDAARDGKDWKRCRDCFTDHIEADFTSLAGGQRGRLAADDLVSAWASVLYAGKRSHHIRTHHQIEIAGDVAIVRSKAYIINAMNRDLGSGLWEIWANFTHSLIREPQSWRCDGMAIYVVHTR